MKKLILLALISTLLYACNQDNKTIENPKVASSKNIITTSDQPNIDIVESSPGQAKVLMENEHVRVVEYSLNPGEKDEWHTHPPRASYVVLGGKLQVHTETDGPKAADVVTGTSSWAGQGAKHWVENIGSTKVMIILTEVKSLQ